MTVHTAAPAARVRVVPEQKAAPRPARDTDDRSQTTDDRRRTARERRSDELLEEAAGVAGAERARLIEEVVLLNLPVARAIAARYRGRGENPEDLEQVAYLALVKAANGYQPGEGHTFLAYAVPTISGELRRHFRDHCWDVRPPRRVQELRLTLGAALADLTQEIGRPPTAPEIAARLGVGADEVIEALVAMEGYSALSLDAPCDGEQGAPLGEVIAAEEDGYDAVEDQLSVEPLLASLPDRDRHILCLRFYRGWTQRQIAADIGVTQMQVSRLLGQALARLRDAATAA